MVKFIYAIFIGALSINAISAVNCEDLSDVQSDYGISGSESILTKENWSKVDVILNYSFDKCLKHVGQSLISVNGEKFWMFTTNYDDCDGGNTYGSIYSHDLSTPIAHIYDGDIYCDQADWRKESQAYYNKCNADAEKLAEKKMKDFGLELKASSSHVRVNKNNYWKDRVEIFVSGDLLNRPGKNATVKVYADVKESCQLKSVNIDYISL